MNHTDAKKSIREVQLETTMRQHLEAVAQARKALGVERLRRELKTAQANVQQLARELAIQRTLSTAQIGQLSRELADLEREHEATQDLLAAVARALRLAGPGELGDWLADSEVEADQPRGSDRDLPSVQSH